MTCRSASTPPPGIPTPPSGRPGTSGSSSTASSFVPSASGSLTPCSSWSTCSSSRRPASGTWLPTLNSARFRLSAGTGRWLSGEPGSDRHGVADGGALQGNGAVAADHGGAELGDWFVGPGFDDLYAAGDDIAGADRCLEVPVHVQEDGPRTGKALRHHRVEDRAGNAALDHDLAES